MSDSEQDIRIEFELEPTEQARAQLQLEPQPTPDSTPGPTTEPTPEFDLEHELFEEFLGDFRKLSLPTQLAGFFVNLNDLVPVHLNYFFHSPHHAQNDIAVLHFITCLPPNEGTATVTEWAAKYAAAAVPERADSRNTRWNLDMIISNIELTVREAQCYLRRGDTRNQEEYDEEAFTEWIRIGDALLETLDDVREKVLSRFPLPQVAVQNLRIRVVNNGEWDPERQRTVSWRRPTEPQPLPSVLDVD
jgi:hypothetical protein